MTLVTRFLIALLLLPTVLTASIAVGPATPVSDPAEAVGAFRPQNDPSVAWNGQIGLVVWRSRMPNGVDFILASRVDATGRPLDPTPLIIRKDAAILFARVATSGSRFLVVWLEAEGVGTRAAFVEADGTIRQLPLAIPAPFYPNDVESFGDVVLLAGNTGTEPYSLVMQWIDRNGNVFAKKSLGSNAFRVEAARAGNDVVVAWWELDCATYTCDHTFFSIDAHPNGTAGEAHRLRFADDADVFAYTLSGFAATADRLLLLFTEAKGVTTGMIFDRSGNALSTAFTIEDSGSAGVPFAVATDGVTFVVAYPHTIFTSAAPIRSTRLRHLTTAGASRPSILSDDTRTVVLTPTSSNFLMVRSGGLVGPSESVSIFASTLNSDGEASVQDVIISRAPNHQESPSAASDGTQVLSVWEEYFPATGLWKIRAGRGITVSESAATQRFPKLVFDGATFLALWVEDEPRQATIRGRRLHADGSAAGSPFQIATVGCASRVDAALVGSEIAVTYLTGGCDFGKPGSVELVTIAPNDTVSFPLVLTQSVLAETPAIAASNKGALVVWTESVNRAPSEPCPNIYEYCPPKQILNGAVIEGRNVQRVPIAAGSQMVNREPQIAWNGSRYLVAWLGAVEVNALGSIQARIFDERGEAAGPVTVAGTADRSNSYTDRRGSVAPFGSGFLVAWQRTYLNDLRLFQLTANGALLDSRQVDSSSREARSPFVVSDGHRAELLYSTTGPDEIYFGHNQVVTRDVGETPRGRAVRRATP